MIDNKRKLIILLAVSALAASSFAGAQTLVAAWNFNSGSSLTSGTFDATTTFAPSQGSGTLAFIGNDPGNVVVFGGTVTNLVEGDETGRGVALAIRNGDVGANNGSFLEFGLDTSAHTNPLEMSFAGQRTSTGFTGIEVSVSSDGGVFVAVTTIDDLPSSMGTTAEVPEAIRTVNFGSLIADDVRVRLTFFGGSTIAASGNNRLDNVQFNVIPEPSTYALIFGLLGLGGVLLRRRFVRK